MLIILANNFCLFALFDEFYFHIETSNSNSKHAILLLMKPKNENKKENQNITQLNNVSGLIENKWTFQIGMIDNYS